MKNKLEIRWLKSKNIVLEKSFVESVKEKAQEYKKVHNISNVEKVYELLGVKKQYLWYYQQNPYSVQSKKNTAISL